jgi:hypothetical protein
MTPGRSLSKGAPCDGGVSGTIARVDISDAVVREDSVDTSVGGCNGITAGAIEVEGFLTTMELGVLKAGLGFSLGGGGGGGSEAGDSTSDSAELESVITALLFTAHANGLPPRPPA